MDLILGFKDKIALEWLSDTGSLRKMAISTTNFKEITGSSYSPELYFNKYRCMEFNTRFIKGYFTLTELYAYSSDRLIYARREYSVKNNETKVYDIDGKDVFHIEGVAYLVPCSRRGIVVVSKECMIYKLNSLKTKVASGDCVLGASLGEYGDLYMLYRTDNDKTEGVFHFYDIVNLRVVDTIDPSVYNGESIFKLKEYHTDLCHYKDGVLKFYKDGYIHCVSLDLTEYGEGIYDNGELVYGIHNLAYTDFVFLLDDNYVYFHYSRQSPMLKLSIKELQKYGIKGSIGKFRRTLIL